MQIYERCLHVRREVMEPLNIDRAVVIHDRNFGNGMFGDVTISRPIIQVDGKIIELMHNTDCEYHMTSRNRNLDLHICFGADDAAYKIDDEHLTQFLHMKKCDHVCEFKKKLFRQMLEQYGPWISDKMRKFIDEYLAKDNTI